MKALANQTRESTSEIESHIKGIQATVGRVVAIVQQIDTSMSEVAALSSEIMGVAARQVSAAQEAVVQARDAVSAVTEVSSSVGAISSTASEAEQMSVLLGSAVTAISRELDHVRDRLTSRLQETLVRDRRQTPRVTTDLRAVVTSGSRRVEGGLSDVSVGGATFAPTTGLVDFDGDILLDLGSLGTVNAAVVRVSDRGAHLAFRLSAAQAARLDGFVKAILDAGPAQRKEGVGPPNGEGDDVELW